jgi:hypothetical protein
MAKCRIVEKDLCRKMFSNPVGETNKGAVYKHAC